VHSFPMYIVMFVDTGTTLWMHPNDIEGVSLVDRGRKSNVDEQGTT